MTRLSRLILTMALCVPLSRAQSSYVNDVMALNPLGYWRLDGNANDATANGNNGVLTNGVTFTGAGGGAPIGDPSNLAAVFNSAQDQYISMPTTASSPLFALDHDDGLGENHEHGQQHDPACQGREQRQLSRSVSSSLTA